MIWRMPRHVPETAHPNVVMVSVTRDEVNALSSAPMTAPMSHAGTRSVEVRRCQSFNLFACHIPVVPMLPAAHAGLASAAMVVV